MIEVYEPTEACGTGVRELHRRTERRRCLRLSPGSFRGPKNDRDLRPDLCRSWRGHFSLDEADFQRHLAHNAASARSVSGNDDGTVEHSDVAYRGWRYRWQPTENARRHVRGDA